MEIMNTKLINKFVFVISAFLMTFSSLMIAFAGLPPLNNSLETASSYEPRVVKVGMTDFPVFSKKQKDGTYQGIVCDYLKEIAKYTGWKLEYVEGTPSELTVMLDNGEIDLMGAMLKSEHTIPLYGFPEYNSGYSYSTLIVKKHVLKYIPLDYSSFNGMVVGIYSKALNRNDSFEAFCSSNGISVNPVYYDNDEDRMAAFENGEVDAILSNDIILGKDHKIIAKFAAVPYYFGVNKNKPDILRQLNSTLSNILNVNPQFDNLLYEKYSVDSSEHDFALTPAEKNYIESAGTLRVAGYDNWAPLQYIDDDGKLSGISVKMLEKLGQITGLKFEYIKTGSYEEALSLMKDGKADILAGLYDNMISEDSSILTLSKSYLSTPTVLVRNVNYQEMGHHKIAMPYGIGYMYPDTDSQIVNYQTIEDCMKAIISGEADYTVANSLVVDYYSHMRGENKLALIPLTQSTGGLCIGFSKPANPTLLSIIDKAINSIPHEEVQAIVFQYSSIKNAKVSLDYLIYNNPEQFILIALGTCIVLFGAVFIIMGMRIRLSRQIALNGETYRILGELADEYIFEYNFESKELNLPEAFTTLIGQKINTVKVKYLGDSKGVSHTLITMFDTEKQNNTSSTVFKCQLADGQEEWFRAVATTLFNAQNKPSRGIGKIVNIQAEMMEKMQLTAKANHDIITGLFNKQYCIQTINRFFELKKPHQQGALVIIDLDYFKQVNDNLGHLAGDEVLKDLSENLKLQFVHNSVVGRWGGDEFIVFLYDVTNETEIEEQVKALCRKMNKEFHYGAKNCIISISAGLAFTTEVSSYEQLFQEADTALYTVKRNRRNGMHVYRNTKG